MKILIAGDFSPKIQGLDLIKKNGYIGKFDDIRKLTSLPDFSIVNFETNVSTPQCKPIKKHGPNLTSIPESVDFVKYLGFNVVTLANNHFYDYGDEAVDNTLRILDEKGIRHVGGGRNIEEAQNILYLKKDSETLAIINACEHEFTIAENGHGGSNPIDPIKIFYSIQTARENANYVLCIIHGGHEHFQLPSLRMQDWYRFFIDAGADAVVNHHQHCYSGMELYKNKPIYYGLGNFLFDAARQKNISSWNEGILVEIEFTSQGCLHREIPYIQCFNDFSLNLNINKETFSSRFEQLNKIINDEKLLKKHNSKFFLKDRKNYTSIFEPYFGRIFRSAYSHGLLPSFITNKKIYSIRNYIECESHLDRLRTVIRNKK